MAARSLCSVRIHGPDHSLKVSCAAWQFLSPWRRIAKSLASKVPGFFQNGELGRLTIDAMQRGLGGYAETTMGLSQCRPLKCGGNLAPLPSEDSRYDFRRQAERARSDLPLTGIAVRRVIVCAVLIAVLSTATVRTGPCAGSLSTREPGYRDAKSCCRRRRWESPTVRRATLLPS